MPVVLAEVAPTAFSSNVVSGAGHETGALSWHIDTPEVVTGSCNSARGEAPRLETSSSTRSVIAENVGIGEPFSRTAVPVPAQRRT